MSGCFAMPWDASRAINFLSTKAHCCASRAEPPSSVVASSACFEDLAAAQHFCMSPKIAPRAVLLSRLTTCSQDKIPRRAQTLISKA